MNKLTLLGLFLIFLSVKTPPAWSEEKILKPMDTRTLLGRSYQPELAYRILLRSTAAVSLASRQMHREPPSHPPAQQPVLRPLSPLPEREPTPPSPAPSKFHSRVLKRLEPYDKHIERYSRMNGVDPNLIRALIYMESSGDPDARSHKGAQGLMQLMPATASDMGVSNPFDPAQNIFGGTRYISTLLNRFDRLDLALWAYNAGPGAVVRKRLPLETKRFIPEVLRIKSMLDRRGS